MISLGNDWDNLLQDEFAKPYYVALRQFLKTEYAFQTIYPDMYHIYEALKMCAYADTRVVILGQDPYHGIGQANGLAFSVSVGVDVPPSLQNIYRELRDDVGCTIPKHGNLLSWAQQGVLLLNTCLTVRADAAHSHRGKGWETLTDAIISLLDQKDKPVVFLLWGNPSRQKVALLKNPKHLVLQAAHPSPLSAHRGFLGCRHFSQTNAFLTQNRQKPINWQIS